MASTRKESIYDIISNHLWQAISLGQIITTIRRLPRDTSRSYLNTSAIAILISSRTISPSTHMSRPNQPG